MDVLEKKFRRVIIPGYCFMYCCINLLLVHIIAIRTSTAVSGDIFSSDNVKLSELNKKRKIRQVISLLIA